MVAQKRGMKCASRAAFSGVIWFLSSAFLLVVRVQSEQYPWCSGMCKEMIRKSILSVDPSALGMQESLSSS